jgi:hypothetical protein
MYTGPSWAAIVGTACSISVASQGSMTVKFGTALINARSSIP